MNRTRSRIRWLALHPSLPWAGLVLLALGCGPAPEPAPPPPVAPTTPQAVVILEPPRLEIGDTATIEVAISVPPGSRVSALAPPAHPPGLWVLGVEGPFVETLPGRDVHRTRFSVRARETGSFSWPAAELQGVTPDGRELALRVPPRPFQVVSVAEELPGQRGFFSYRRPTRERTAHGLAERLVPALVGAALALAGMALVSFVRRVRGARAGAAPRPPPETAPWCEAQRALAAAAARVDGDPIRAADLGSLALRRYLDQRFGTDTVTSTTEELRQRRTAPFLLTTRWEELLSLLEAFDALRFRPPDPREGVADPLRETLRRAGEFVADTIPRQAQPRTAPDRGAPAP